MFIGKSFTDHTTEDHQLAVRINLTGFFLVTCVIAVMLNACHATRSRKRS